MYYFGHDPQTEKGKFCTECGNEHFNEGDLCTWCERLLKYENNEEGD